jgi:hypothetical protein
MKPVGILYEHLEWFAPLFAELDRRQLPYERIPALDHRFDPTASSAPYSLVVNRVSPSSYLRDHTSAIFHAQQYLLHLEAIGVPVVNGPRAYALELSKAQQVSLLAALEIPHPRSRVVNHVDQIAAAAAELAYPIIVKPNIGGSGALMWRFDTAKELRTAANGDELQSVFGLDYTAVVQEYHPPREARSCSSRCWTVASCMPFASTTTPVRASTSARPTTVRWRIRRPLPRGQSANSRSVRSMRQLPR